MGAGGTHSPPPLCLMGCSIPCRCQRLQVGFGGEAAPTGSSPTHTALAGPQRHEPSHDRLSGQGQPARLTRCYITGGCAVCRVESTATGPTDSVLPASSSAWTTDREVSPGRPQSDGHTPTRSTEHCRPILMAREDCEG